MFPDIFLKRLRKKIVHSPLFSRKIVEIECFALRAAILHECQNYLVGGGVVHLKLKMAAINLKRAISQQSHKIGACEQST